MTDKNLVQELRDEGFLRPPELPELEAIKAMQELILVLAGVVQAHTQSDEVERLIEKKMDAMNWAIDRARQKDEEN